MKKSIQLAQERGKVSFGWLDSNHSFSFGHYHNPERMQFGALRVLNDDWVAPGKGFDTHPHRNMEIISIGLEGALEHKDSMGNTAVIGPGDVQVMSAGTGVTHSEYNKNVDQPVAFLQIWIIPDRVNVTPRYDQLSLDSLTQSNSWNLFLGPYDQYENLWIYQNVWFHWGLFETGAISEYVLKNPGHGLYVFVVEGSVWVAGEKLGQRDALEISEISQVSFEFFAPSKVLLMEVPLNG